MLVKLLIYSQTSTAGPLKVENGWIILSHTLLGTWLLVHAVIKVNPLHRRGATGGWISSTAYRPQFIPDYWFCWIIMHVSPIKDIVISRICNGRSATHPKLSGPDCIQEESCLLLCFISPRRHWAMTVEVFSTKSEPFHLEPTKIYIVTLWAQCPWRYDNDHDHYCHYYCIYHKHHCYHHYHHLHRYHHHHHYRHY